jgi:hypothetical protein
MLFPQVEKHCVYNYLVLTACLLVFESVPLSESYQNVHQSTKGSSPLPSDEYMLLAGKHLHLQALTIDSQSTDSFYLQSFCMYGYDAGVLGGVQTTKPFLDAMNHPTGTYVIPMIASSYTLAAAVCSLAVTMLGMPLGRRGCILMGDAFVIVGAILQASAWSVPQIIVGRCLCGFGIGFISCSVPTYMVRRNF